MAIELNPYLVSQIRRLGKCRWGWFWDATAEPSGDIVCIVSEMLAESRSPPHNPSDVSAQRLKQQLTTEWSAVSLTQG